jgi:hypothetical protein
MATAGASGGAPAEIILMLSGEVLAKAVVDVINNRRYLIKGRSIV